MPLCLSYILGQRSAGVGLVGDVTDNRPDEAHKFLHHRGGDLAGMLVSDTEPAVATTKTLLCLPGDRLYAFWSRLCVEMARLARGKAIIPRGFHQDAPNMSVTCLGDGTGATEEFSLGTNPRKLISCRG